jgi:hypothetical protein
MARNDTMILHLLKYPFKSYTLTKTLGAWEYPGKERLAMVNFHWINISPIPATFVLLMEYIFAIKLA